MNSLLNNDQTPSTNSSSVPMNLDGGARIPMGMLSLIEIHPAHRSIEIGNVIYAPALQRTAATTEANLLLLRHSFALGYRRISWFAGLEYQKLLAAKAATPPVPATIKAAAAEIRHVVTLATTNMLKFCSPAKLSAYMESCALRAAVKDGLEEKEIAALNGVASAVDAVGELVERIPNALATAAKVGGSRGKKRKRGAEEVAEVEEEGVTVDLR
ncbi:hypothetical protein VE02_07898 [Pseudogymnoascus sp. 03VT05]|nr:hypothetical protein VE02_07898 [Pseudogymnoascus sp. 03VT05]